MANSISLEELVALNDEIAGLVRSGVPLEMGLAGWGRDLPGNLGRVVTHLGESIARGQSLSQSLDEDPRQFPPVYRSVVVAGMRSGRLPAALESLTTSARNLEEVRRCVGLAVLYPIVLLVLGYFLFWLLLAYVLPMLLGLYEGNPPKFWSAVADVGRLASSEISIPFTSRVILAGWIPPLAVALVWFAWALSRPAGMFGAGAAGRWLEWLPFAGRAVRHARLASLAEILGLLVEHDVPLGEAAVLAAECTADRRLIQSAREMADSLAQGGSPPSPERLAEFPPLLAWLVSVGGRQQTFVSVSRHVADTYRRRIARDSRWLREVLPMWLVVIVGGSLVALFGLTTFLPFSQLLEHLSAAVGQTMRIKP